MIIFFKYDWNMCFKIELVVEIFFIDQPAKRLKKTRLWLDETALQPAVRQLDTPGG